MKEFLSRDISHGHRSDIKLKTYCYSQAPTYLARFQCGGWLVVQTQTAEIIDKIAQSALNARQLVDRYRKHRHQNQRVENAEH